MLFKLLYVASDVKSLQRCSMPGLICDEAANKQGDLLMNKGCKKGILN